MKTWILRGAWLILVAGAGLTTWLLLANRPGGEPTLTAAASQGPDYRLYGAQVKRYADSGAQQYLLSASQVAHLPASGASALTTVTLDYYPGTAANASWRMTAVRGLLNADGNQLALAGDVRARELAVRDPVHFAAPTVEVYLERHQVHSDAKVKVWQGARETTGTGMQADLRAGTLKLLKDVTSRYVP